MPFVSLFCLIASARTFTPGLYIVMSVTLGLVSDPRELAVSPICDDASCELLCIDLTVFEIHPSHNLFTVFVMKECSSLWKIYSIYWSDNMFCNLFIKGHVWHELHMGWVCWKLCGIVSLLLIQRVIQE